MKVSVVIPTYNCEKYIAESIKSVLAQTYSDFELIVVDDGSKDNTREVILNFGDKVRYYYQDNNGVSSARNYGIEMAKGKYISFLDSDDIFEKDFLLKMVNRIEGGNNDWVVCDNYREFKSSDNELLDKKVIKRELGESWTNSELMKEFLIEDRVGSPNKIIVNTEILKKHNIRFDQNLNSREDWDFCIQLIDKQLSVGWVKEPLVTYRVWDDNTNSTRKMGHRWLDYTVQFLEKHEKIFIRENIKHVLSDHYYDLARHYWYIKDFKNTLLCIFRSVIFGGFSNLRKTIMGAQGRMGV